MSFPALISMVQGLIASLASSYLFSELWIVLSGLPVVCTLTCFSGQSWPPMPKESVNYVFLFCSASSFPIFLGPLPCSHIPGIICTWRSLPHFPVYDSDFQWGSTSGLVSTFLTKALISCFSPLSVLTYESFLPEQDQTACFSKASACKTRVVALKIEG